MSPGLHSGSTVGKRSRTTAYLCLGAVPREPLPADLCPAGVWCRYNRSMSQRNRERRSERKAIEKARKITVGKMVRLFVKSVLLAAGFVVVVTLLNALGVPYLDRLWGQLVVLGLLWIVAYPLLMRDFRPRTYLKDR